MRASDWLETLKPFSFYPESKLYELDDCGFRYEPEAASVLCLIKHGVYPPYGRRVSAPVMTERELIAAYNDLGFNPRFKWRGDERFVIGFHIAEMVWRLVAPITIEEAPSHFRLTPEDKARADIAAIRGYGY